MLGLYSDKTHGAMTNHDDGDHNGDHNGNKEGNDNDIAASGSGFYGPIFGPVGSHG